MFLYFTLNIRDENKTGSDIILWLLLCRAAYGLIERPNDFASYLLAIAICNLLLYFAFYIIMKVCVCVCVFK